MRAPDYLISAGITALACVGDGRQSGTSASPSILNASPEAAAGGGLALLRTGDRVRIDLKRGTADMLLSEEELDARRAALKSAGGYVYPAHQTPWQEIQPWYGQPTRGRRRSRAGGRISAHRPEQGTPAGQSLSQRSRSNGRN